MKEEVRSVSNSVQHPITLLDCRQSDHKAAYQCRCNQCSIGIGEGGCQGDDGNNRVTCAGRRGS